jgi:hypothetical protein
MVRLPFRTGSDRSEPGPNLRSAQPTCGPWTCRNGSGPPFQRTEPRTYRFGSVRTPVQKGPDRTVDSVPPLKGLEIGEPQLTLALTAAAVCCNLVSSQF